MGCATSENAHRFDAECDLLTGTSKPLAESGRGDPVALPAGLTMSTRLEGYSETRDQAEPSRRFEFTVTLSDSLAEDGILRAEVGLGNDAPELVDDSGQRFRCRRARVPDPESPGAAQRGASLLYFDLPPTYRFRAIGYVTVHWLLRLRDLPAVPISSRFHSRPDA